MIPLNVELHSIRTRAVWTKFFLRTKHIMDHRIARLFRFRDVLAKAPKRCKRRNSKASGFKSGSWASA